MWVFFTIIQCDRKSEETTYNKQNSVIKTILNLIFRNSESNQTH